tara:strand:+ start:1681 stop:1851 length:171 start_codon:yes stop_codon:yes gene_type:complete
MAKNKKDKKIEKVMREYKMGTLKSGNSDKKVKNRKQAIAIAISESRKKKKKKRRIT